MAAKRKGCLGGCLGTLLGLVIILAIVFLVVINLTPNTIKLGDTKIPGIEKTCNEMGLGDTKIKDVYKALKSLTKDSETLRKEIVDKPADTDTTEANKYYGADANYTNIFSEPLALQSAATLTDQQFGGVLNAASSGLASEIGLPSDAVAVEQVKFTTNEEGKTQAEVTMSVKLEEVLNTAGMSQDDLNMVTDALSKVGVSLSDAVFVSVDAPLDVQNGTVSADGANAELTINNNPELTSIISALTSGNEEFSIDTLTSSAATMLANAMNNMGGDVTLEDGSITVTPES